MANLLNSSWGYLNSTSYLNQGLGEFMQSTAECVATGIGTLGQSSILEESGYKKTIKIATTYKQIIVKRA